MPDTQNHLETFDWWNIAHRDSAKPRSLFDLQRMKGVQTIKGPCLKVDGFTIPQQSVNDQSVIQMSDNIETNVSICIIFVVGGGALLSTPLQAAWVLPVLL